MESVETPVKDGVLYQQHMKFGKVGAPGCLTAVGRGRNLCLSRQPV